MGAQKQTNSSVKTGFSRTGARTGVWLIWEKLGQHRQIQIQNAPQLLNCGVVFIMQFLRLQHYVSMNKSTSLII
jgi:hypothetical protein